MKYYLLSTITRLLLGKLRKYHKKEDQLLVFSRDFIGEEVFAYGVYEKNEINTILSSLDFDLSESNALDIGANIGNHTLQFSKHFKNVYCFEPNKIIFDILKINTRNRTNTHLFNFGLSHEATRSYLTVPEFNFGGASITKTKEVGSVEINLKVYDEEFDQEISLVKIDVEGHELNVLKGMVKAISKNKPVICFELINTDSTATNLIEGLKEMGYRKFYSPHKRGIFATSNSSILTFVNGMFYKLRPELKEITRFDKKLYNLILCEHEDSKFHIKEENII